MHYAVPGQRVGLSAIQTFQIERMPFDPTAKLHIRDENLPDSPL
jgi:hypothetical protein